MKTVNKLPKRKELRLKNIDYNSCGTYFVTICTHEKKQIPSDIIDDKIHLTEVEKLVKTIIDNTDERLLIG